VLRVGDGCENETSFSNGYCDGVFVDGGKRVTTLTPDHRTTSPPTGEGLPDHCEGSGNVYGEDDEGWNAPDGLNPGLLSG
jgi:hypothetical protein